MESGTAISLVVSGLSLIASVVSAIVAYRAVRMSQRVAMETSALQLHNFADAICIKNPALYELHGIAADALSREDVTPDELSYVVHSFDAGAAYYQIASTAKVELTEFRRNMLRHPKVRKVWKAFIVGKTLSRSPFTDAVDRYIAEIERRTQKE